MTNRKNNFSFMRLCSRKNCSNTVYIDDSQNISKELCLKHWNDYIDKKFKRLTKIKRIKCKFCKKIIENKNKVYCSKYCKWSASRKTPNISLEQLVKSYEWRRVERLIKTSPLGLSSIKDIKDLIFLFILCKVDRLYSNSAYSFFYIVPLRLGGMNTLDNIIIAPKIIKKKSPLKSGYNEHDVDAYYVTDSIIDTCLRNKKDFVNFDEVLIDIVDVNINNFHFQEYRLLFNRFENLYTYQFENKKTVFDHFLLQKKYITYFNRKIDALVDITLKVKKLSAHLKFNDISELKLYDLIGEFIYILLLNSDPKLVQVYNELVKKLSPLSPEKKFFYNDTFFYSNEDEKLSLLKEIITDVCEFLQIKIKNMKKNKCSRSNCSEKIFTKEKYAIQLWLCKKHYQNFINKTPKCICCKRPFIRKHYSDRLLCSELCENLSSYSQNELFKFIELMLQHFCYFPIYEVSRSNSNIKRTHPNLIKKLLFHEIFNRQCTLFSDIKFLYNVRKSRCTAYGYLKDQILRDNGNYYKQSYFSLLNLSAFYMSDIALLGSNHVFAPSLIKKIDQPDLDLFQFINSFNDETRLEIQKKLERILNDNNFPKENITESLFFRQCICLSEDEPYRSFPIFNILNNIDFESIMSDSDSDSDSAYSLINELKNALISPLINSSINLSKIECLKLELYSLAVLYLIVHRLPNQEKNIYNAIQILNDIFIQKYEENETFFQNILRYKLKAPNLWGNNTNIDDYLFFYKSLFFEYKFKLF